MSRIVTLVPAAICALTLAGCGSGQSSARPDTGKFQQLVGLYSHMVKGGGPPASEAAFKTAINGNIKYVADALKVTDAEALFTGRDGKPIVVVYGARPANMDPNVVAYEQDGVDGKRLVGFSLGSIEEADETRFRELVPAAAAK